MYVDQSISREIYKEKIIRRCSDRWKDCILKDKCVLVRSSGGLLWTWQGGFGFPESQKQN